MEEKETNTQNNESMENSGGDGIVVPSMEMLEAELKKEQYRNNYTKVLKSTVFSLLVVAAIAVLIAVLLLPVLQIS